MIGRAGFSGEFDYRPELLNIKAKLGGYIIADFSSFKNIV